MSSSSQAFTIPASADIHVRSTRILRTARRREDDRATEVSAVARDACGSCGSALELAAKYCGICGRRAHERASLEGMLLDGLYRVGPCLAEGATASIYQACYVPSGAQVALKVLHSELAFDPEVRARFRREARCLSRLRDPRIVAASDHGETADGIAFIAMELLRGERLDLRLRSRGAMPWRDALAIVRDICGALGAMHAQGIVHRDLTMTNIVLIAGDAVKLIDLGLAKQRSDDGDQDLTRAGRSLGILRRVAPEQLAGRPSDARTDLYAVGVIACELLAGGLAAGEPITRALPATTPREVVALLKRCLAVEPAGRFSTAAELALAIDRLLLAAAPPAPALEPRRRRIYGHTPAFELEPPRIAILPPDPPAFARGSQPDLPVVPERDARWKLWAAALVVCGIGLGTAVAGCV